MITDQQAWFPYCGAAPVPADLLSRWNFDPLLIATTLVLLGWGWWRLRSTFRARAAAAAVVAVLFISPFCVLGSALFSVRAVHHLALTLVLAPLLVSALDGWRLPVRLGLLAATLLQIAVYWAWHFAPLYEFALSSDAAFWAMQLSITASAMVWWTTLRRASVLAAAASVLAAMVQMGLLGALLVFTGRAFYAPHWLTTQVWGLSPLEDQQIAGLVMWVLGSGAYLALAAALIYRALAPGTGPLLRSQSA
ncbi:MAG: cytochrome c oxidase assembly protein [Novosphingobium sp.]|nr:cytochrome c oxidase assembly protein [Novosphingobium sp.]